MNRVLLMLLLTSASTASTASAAGPGFSPDPAGIPQDRSECVLQAGSGVVDYGVMSRWQLQETGRGGEVTPGARVLPVTVACSYTQPFRLRIAGNDGVGGRVRYGSVGWLNLWVSNLRVDGQTTGIRITSADRGKNEFPSGAGMLANDSLIMPVIGGQAVSGRTMTFDLHLEPRLKEQQSRVAAPTQSEAGLHITLD